MYSNRLKLNASKTELTVFVSPGISRSLPSLLPVLCSDQEIPPQPGCKNLGCFFESCLSMSSHVKQICKASNYHLNKLYRIRPCLDFSSTESLVHAFISSRVDYCNSLLYGISKQNLVKLQRLQNAAARLCLQIPRKALIPSKSLLSQLHWLPVEYRINFKILLITFKALNGLAPPYIFFLTRRTSPCTLRSFDSELLVVPKTRTKTFGDRAFPNCAPRLWNDLLLAIRTSSSVFTFKKALKTHFCRLAYD